MIRVCLIDGPNCVARFVRKLLEDPSFEVTVCAANEICPCDVIVAGKEFNAGVPVVVYNRQLNLKNDVIQASVVGLYKPLHDSINEALEIVRPK